jgi:hypothetical protein
LIPSVDVKPHLLGHLTVNRRYEPPDAAKPQFTSSVDSLNKYSEIQFGPIWVNYGLSWPTPATSGVGG